MSIIEFIFLVLGAICLIDFIITSIVIYQYKELANLVGLNIETQIRRHFEILIIIITIAIFTYKFIS